MKWVTYLHPNQKTRRAGLLYRKYVLDLQYILKQSNQEENIENFPVQLLEYMDQQDTYKPGLTSSLEAMENWSEEEWAKHKAGYEPWIFTLDQVQLYAPLPLPRSVRDFYAFEQHVQMARAKRGLDMVEEWYHFPVFYFSNHQAIIGPDEPISFPSRSQKWDFELEVGIVIGKEGRDISKEEAFDYVFGLTILNDWSARDLQAEEVKVGLGPAKAKDFATSLGPFIASPEEWNDCLEGEQLQLEMEASINGEVVSKGNLDQLYFSIPQLIERASQDCTLYPGDVLGTGTVGTGCLLEHNDPTWLRAKDVVQLKVERLGTLSNPIK